MIKILCDRCGADCGRVGYEIRVASIHNPTPLHAKDLGDLRITDETAKYRFVLCQKCYRAMGFPNCYEVIEEGKLTFREAEMSIDAVNPSRA